MRKREPLASLKPVLGSVLERRSLEHRKSARRWREKKVTWMFVLNKVTLSID